MRHLILPAAALAALATPVYAQDASADEAALADMAAQMRDPVRQQDIALMLQTMTEIMLDMPIAPLAQAAAEMVGEQAERIDPDTTLRKMVPQAGRVSAEIGRNAPRAMAAASTMVEAMAKMTPMMRAMAERMAQALPGALPEHAPKAK